MLSAIAARKAAQAALQKNLNKSTEPTTGPSPPKSPVEASPSPKPPPKRKSSAQTSRPPKRKKKERKPSEKTPRYFTDSFKDQEDVIVVDSDDEDSVISFDLPESIITKTPGERAWSPSAPVHPSSDDSEDESTPLPIPSTAPQPHNVSASAVLSTFQPVLNQNTFILDAVSVSALGIASDSGSTVVALQPSETICLLGVYLFHVLQGSITLCGVSLGPSLKGHRVYAPRSSPLPILQGIDGDSKIPNINKLPRPLQSLQERPVALILLQELETGVESLGQVCRTFDGVFEPSRWHKPDDLPQLQLSGVHMITRQTKDTQPFDLPHSWEMALSSRPSEFPAGVHLVKGPKKSAKSTFAKVLLNSLLTRYQKVAYLECDLGQSEFTPGGMVAINLIELPCFGPPFTHPTLPYLAHYIGSTTPRSSPSHYLSAVQSILESYRLDLQTPDVTSEISGDDARISDTIPLVINTMGWHKGLGADLTQKIQDMAEPTDIYEIEAPSFDTPWTALPPRNSPSMTSATKVHLLQAIPSSVLSTNYTAADHRSISLLSYLHANFPSSPSDELAQVTATTWDTSLPLCARPPYKVDCAKTFDKVILTGAGMEDVVPSEIRLVLNTAIVALVTCDPGTLDSDDSPGMVPDGSSLVPYSQGFPVPSPATSRCHGLALIRSTSSTSSYVHLLTPLPWHLLAKSRVIVKGEMELPVWGMLDWRGDGEGVAGVEKGKVPYLQWGKGEGIGGQRRRVRRNLMRRGQM